MRPFLNAMLLIIFSLAPSAISAQTSVSGINVGPHGNDYFIGTWTCRNSVPGPGFPAVITTIGTRSGSSPSDIIIHSTGQNFDSSGYLHYDAKTQTWWNPGSSADGTAINESSRQTGKTTVWTGTLTDASGTKQIRDTFVQPDMRKFSDVTEIQNAGVWKTVQKSECTKS